MERPDLKGSKGRGVLRARLTQLSFCTMKGKGPRNVSSAPKMRQQRKMLRCNSRGQALSQRGSQAWEHYPCSSDFTVMKDTLVKEL